MNREEFLTRPAKARERVPDRSFVQMLALVDPGSGETTNKGIAHARWLSTKVLDEVRRG